MPLPLQVNGEAAGAGMKPSAAAVDEEAPKKPWPLPPIAEDDIPAGFKGAGGAAGSEMPSSQSKTEHRESQRIGGCQAAFSCY